MRTVIVSTCRLDTLSLESCQFYIIHVGCLLTINNNVTTNNNNEVIQLDHGNDTVTYHDEMMEEENHK
jgi:hypothetical protein